MSELESLLREAKDRGELNYISMAFTASGFECVFRGVTTGENVRGKHKSDPVAAMLLALREGKKAFRSKKTRLPTKRMEEGPNEDLSFEEDGGIDFE